MPYRVFHTCMLLSPCYYSCLQEDCPKSRMVVLDQSLQLMIWLMIWVVIVQSWPWIIPSLHVMMDSSIVLDEALRFIYLVSSPKVHTHSPYTQEPWPCSFLILQPFFWYCYIFHLSSVLASTLHSRFLIFPLASCLQAGRFRCVIL